MILGIYQSKDTLSSMKKIFNRKCQECKSHRILYDELKGEVYCLDCGLIQDEVFSVFSIMKYEMMMKLQEDQMRHFLMKHLETI